MWRLVQHRQLGKSAARLGSTGDAYGTPNNAGIGIETGTPNLSVPVNTGLFNVTGVNFGIEQRPTAGNGTNSVINPGGTKTVAVPANTFS